MFFYFIGIYVINLLFERVIKFVCREWIEVICRRVFEWNINIEVFGNFSCIIY